MRRKTLPDSSLAPPPSRGGAARESEKQDLFLLSTAITNSDDLAPFVSKAFAFGRPDSLLQSVAAPLLSSLDSYLETSAVARNLAAALSSAHSCVLLLDLWDRANDHFTDDNLYCALRAVDSLERDFLLPDAVPSAALRRMLQRQIPTFRAQAERCISKDFSDWMVHIRVASRNLGKMDELDEDDGGSRKRCRRLRT